MDIQSIVIIVGVIFGQAGLLWRRIDRLEDRLQRYVDAHNSKPPAGGANG